MQTEFNGEMFLQFSALNVLSFLYPVMRAPGNFWIEYRVYNYDVDLYDKYSWIVYRMRVYDKKATYNSFLQYI